MARNVPAQPIRVAHAATAKMVVSAISIPYFTAGPTFGDTRMPERRRLLTMDG